jgi:hypothetical protein
MRLKWNNTNNFLKISMNKKKYHNRICRGNSCWKSAEFDK